MYEFGLIGYGSMGSTLLNGFLNAGVLSPGQIIVSNRSKAKLADLKARWPAVTIAADNRQAARASKMLLIGVKPRDVRGLMDEIIQDIPGDTHLVIITSGVTLQNVESLFPGKITKVIPSITAEAGQGVSLACHNARVGESEAAWIGKLFGAISIVKVIEERQFEAAADLTSCGPGLLSAMVQEFALAGARHGAFTPEEAERMVISTLYGTAKLLYENGLSPDEVISRVATRGGITEEGVKVLRKTLPSAFDEVFDTTLNKHEIVKAAIRQQFDEPGRP
jgi:pyrroline-5-carboxylate reductase